MKRCLPLLAVGLTFLVSGCAEGDAPRAAARPAVLIETVANAQPLPRWEPQLGQTPDFSPEAIKRLKELYDASPKDMPSVYEIFVGCSWYCGGEMNNVKSSSTLPKQAANTYTANNAHDLRYDTAWVEGVSGPGIGETLTYTFTNKAPRITEILIHTGYIKDEDTWLKNNRVKTLELAINGEPTAVLRLADTRAQQSFDLNELGPGPLGRRAGGEDLVLRFKILDIYPGTEFDDTAISEIYFDGIDVH